MVVVDIFGPHNVSLRKENGTTVKDFCFAEECDECAYRFPNRFDLELPSLKKLSESLKENSKCIA